MHKYKIIVFMGILCGVVPWVSGAQWPCADNFDDGVRNTNLWADMVVISAGDETTLMETNGALHYVRDNSNGFVIAFQPLCASIPIASDWEARVRIHSPSMPFTTDDGVFLGLGLTADTPVQSGKGPVIVGLINTGCGYLNKIFFNFAACPSNMLESEIHDKKTCADGWVRLRWQAAVSNLYADYTTDTNLGWRTLGGPRCNPLQVAASNHFVLGVCGGSQNWAVPVSEGFWLDDFSSVTNPYFGVSATVITNLLRESTNGTIRVAFPSRFSTVYDLQGTTNLTMTNGWRYNNLPALGDAEPLSLVWTGARTGACGFVRVASMGVASVITNFASAENLLDSPERIRQYMQGHIDYCGRWDDPESYHVGETNDYAHAPTNVFARGRGDCRDQSVLFAYLLNYHDDVTHSRFNVHTVRFNWNGGQSEDHTIAVYKDTDGVYRYFSDASVYGPLDPTNTIMDALLNFERQRLGFTTIYTNRVYEAPTDPYNDFIFDNLPMNQW